MIVIIEYTLLVSSLHYDYDCDMCLLYRRAKGETVTIATWMRDFVSTHPSYTHDSVLNHEVVHDLMMACKQIGEGVLPCKPVLGDVSINRFVCLVYYCFSFDCYSF